MFLLRNHSLLQESQKCLPGICKILHCHMSSGKYVPVRVLPRLSKQMISEDSNREGGHQLQYKMKGIHGVMDLAKRGQVQDAELLFKKLEKVPRLKLGVGVCMALYDMHVKAGNVRESLEALQRLHHLHPLVILQPYKVLNFAILLLKHGQTEQCLQLLQDEAPNKVHHSPTQLQKQEWAPDVRSNIMDRLGQQLLQTAADGGDAALMRRLVNELLRSGYCAASRALLAPLVRVHLGRSDPKAALQALEEVATQHRCMPCKAELLLAFVTHQDTDSLTRLMRLSTAVIGRPQTVFDLAIAMLEAGQLDKAARIIKEEEVYLETERLQYLCELYITRRQPQHLHSLAALALASSATSQDALMVRAHLFLCYELVGDMKAASDLLAEVEREGLTKEELLDLGPASLLQLLKVKPPSGAVAELPSPSHTAQNTKPLQRSRSLSREAPEREQGRRSRSSSFSKNKAFYTGDNNYSERSDSRESSRALLRDGRREREEFTERSYESDSYFGRYNRNEAANSGDAGVRKSGSRRHCAAPVHDVW